MTLEVLTGVSNSKVQESLAGCDVVLDECFSDTPIAGLGAEAAAKGIPAFTFGYAGTDLDHYFRAFGIPHEQFATPEDLVATVNRIIADPEWVREVALATHTFVNERWSPRGVAQKMAMILRDEIPADWWVEPTGLRYCWGYGMDRQTAVAAWREFKRRYGVGAFGLADDNPVLREILEAVSAESPP